MTLGIAFTIFAAMVCCCCMAAILSEDMKIADTILFIVTLVFSFAYTYGAVFLILKEIRP